MKQVSRAGLASWEEAWQRDQGRYRPSSHGCKHAWKSSACRRLCKQSVTHLLMSRQGFYKSYIDMPRLITHDIISMASVPSVRRKCSMKWYFSPNTKRGVPQCIGLFAAPCPSAGWTLAVRGCPTGAALAHVDGAAGRSHSLWQPPRRKGAALREI